MVTCRECEYEINQATEICPHCGADLTSLPEESTTPAKKPTLGKILLRWGMLLGVLLAAMWSFLWFVVTPRTGNVTAEAEANAVAAIHDVYAQLRSYADARRAMVISWSTRPVRPRAPARFITTRSKRAPGTTGIAVFTWISAAWCEPRRKIAAPPAPMLLFIRLSASAELG